MATSKEIQECIEFIEKMEVLVNYKNNKFLGKEKEYKESKTKLASRANEEMLRINPKAKKQIAEAFIPFIDEVRGELYLLIKTHDKKTADMYLKSDKVFATKDGKKINKFNRGVHLVYQDLASRGAVFADNYDDFGDLLTSGETILYERVPLPEEYSFNTLPNLLNKIAKVTTEYCKQMDKEKDIDRTEDLVGEGKRGQVAPLFIRQICAWVCYTLLCFGDTISKCFKQEPLTTQSGVCSQIMHDLHLRTKHDYEYEYFAKEKKLLEYNKWSIMPEVILRKGNFFAPVAPFMYAGHKDGYLGFMLQKLVEQRNFKQYLEPFGGSGIAITQFKKKQGVSYFLSDANYMNMCYYKLLKASDKDFDYCLIKIEDIQKQVDMLYARIDKLDIKYPYYKSNFQNIKKKGFDKYYIQGQPFDSSQLTDDDIVEFFGGKIEKGDNRFLTFRNEATVALEVFYALKDLYRPYYNLYTFCGKNILDNSTLSKNTTDWKDFAVAFVVLNASLVNGQVSIDQSVVSPPTLRNMEIRRRLNFIRENFSKVTLEPSAIYGADAMRLLGSSTYNQENVLTYLDSPYLNTAGYASGFGIKDIKKLVNACISFRGDLIYSCRINLPKSASKSKKSKEEFVSYFKMWLDVKKSYEGQGKVCKALFLCNDEKINYPKWGISEELYMRMFNEGVARSRDLYLAYYIATYNDFEIMITNFDFEVPDFIEFARYIEARQEKYEEATGDNGLFKISTFKVAKPSKKSKSSITPAKKEFVKVDIEEIVKLITCIYG